MQAEGRRETTAGVRCRRSIEAAAKRVGERDGPTAFSNLRIEVHQVTPGLPACVPAPPSAHTHRAPTGRRFVDQNQYFGTDMSPWPPLLRTVDWRLFPCPLRIRIPPGAPSFRSHSAERSASSFCFCARGHSPVHVGVKHLKPGSSGSKRASNLSSRSGRRMSPQPSAKVPLCPCRAEAQKERRRAGRTTLSSESQKSEVRS